MKRSEVARIIHLADIVSTADAPPSYRFFFLNASGSIIRRVEVECDNDEDALRRARGLNHAEGIEIWQGARKVGATPPTAGI